MWYVYYANETRLVPVSVPTKSIRVCVIIYGYPFDNNT